MTLSDLAALGSFVSGIAVLISFIFLTVQLQQSARNQRATVHNERASLAHSAIQLGFDLGDVYLRGQAADPTLDPVSATRFVNWAVSALWVFEEEFYQHRDKMLDETRWAQQVRRFRGMCIAPGFRAACRVLNPLFELDFVAWMNGIMDETSAAAGYELPNVWKAAAAAELRAAQPASAFPGET